MIYMIKFFVKDEETADNRYLYPILLYSHDDESLNDFFNGVKP